MQTGWILDTNAAFLAIFLVDIFAWRLGLKVSESESFSPLAKSQKKVSCVNTHLQCVYSSLTNTGSTQIRNRSPRTRPGVRGCARTPIAGRRGPMVSNGRTGQLLGTWHSLRTGHQLRQHSIAPSLPRRGESWQKPLSGRFGSSWTSATRLGIPPLLHSHWSQPPWPAPAWRALLCICRSASAGCLEKKVSAACSRSCTWEPRETLCTLSWVIRSCLQAWRWRRSAPWLSRPAPISGDLEALVPWASPSARLWSFPSTAFPCQSLSLLLWRDGWALPYLWLTDWMGWS